MFHQILNAMKDDGALNILDLPPEIKNIFERLVSKSAFVFKGAPDLHFYTKGSSAGTPFADIFFVVIMCRILTIVYSEFASSGLAYQFPFRASPLVSQEEVDEIKVCSRLLVR